ncbi:hypothetical protein HPP92_004978 [Vanilla planifolia]|uniref:Uncharacterized protein n=1 Tax=Vanilla planifolia TaxID=51239 RepID=A0A835RNS1_VANPL|nr:hypothetical protein HPP92_004978 [Vanilla planifolia]
MAAFEAGPVVRDAIDGEEVNEVHRLLARLALVLSPTERHDRGDQEQEERRMRRRRRSAPRALRGASLLERRKGADGKRPSTEGRFGEGNAGGVDVGYKGTGFGEVSEGREER